MKNMRTWDEYEIHLLKKWCEKNQVSLLVRKEKDEENPSHFDIRRSDIPVLMKDDMLYRGNWKGNKAKYQVLYPMNLFWDMIFVSIWSGLQKLSDWVNALCTLRNVVPHEGLTEFQLNQYRFTIWNERDGEWFCFDIQKNIVGRRDAWSPDAPIQWSPLPSIQPPSLQEDSYHGFLHENTLETKPKVEAVSNPKPEAGPEVEPEAEAELEREEENRGREPTIQDDDTSKQEQEEEKVEEVSKKNQWTVRDIQSWLLLGCPITKPSQLIKKQKKLNSDDDGKEEEIGETRIEEETSDIESSSSSFVSRIVADSSQTAGFCLEQKKQFLEHWWFLSQWGRRSHPSRPFTQIIIT